MNTADTESTEPVSEVLEQMLVEMKKQTAMMGQIFEHLEFTSGYRACRPLQIDCEKPNSTSCPASCGGNEWITELTAALNKLPREVAQTFLDRLQALFSSAVVEFSDSSDLAACGTRRGCISLRVVGVHELIAAARAAA